MDPRPAEPESTPDAASRHGEAPMRRYRLVLAYDGADFHGWQKQQPPSGEPLRTVQQAVEDAIVRLLGRRINLVGASRTDAGVHATGQVATFDARSPIPLQRMLPALNDRLPEDVECRGIDVVPDAFDVINHPRAKRYRYRVHVAGRRPIEKRRFVCPCIHRLDADRMAEAGELLAGTHDFAAFAAERHGRSTTVRTVFRCVVETGEGITAADPFFACDRGEEIHIVVEGDGFLYNMVRIIAGTLIDIGRGLYEPGRVRQMHLAGDRALGGFTAPARGLCLERIWYPA